MSAFCGIGTGLGSSSSSLSTISDCAVYLATISCSRSSIFSSVAISTSLSMSTYCKKSSLVMSPGGMSTSSASSTALS